MPRSTSPTTATPRRSTTSIAATPTTGGGSNGGAASTVHITDFRVTPSSPVQCNAPTEIELTWTTSGAVKVTLLIDGRTFAAYGPGPQDHLEYFACDGRPHTYTLRAEAGADTATASTTVRSR
jgi:hypothetical protein